MTTRNEIINAIIKNKKDIKDNTTFIKSLTKMRKDELKKVLKNIVNDENNKYDDELSEIEYKKMLYTRDNLQREILELEVLEKQKDQELKELDNEEPKPLKQKKKVIIEEVEEVEEVEEEEEEEEPKPKKKPKQKTDIAKLEKDVRALIKKFNNIMSDVINQYENEYLTDEDIKYIIDYHNEQKNLIADKLEIIYDKLGDLNFSNAFNNFIDTNFNKWVDKIDNLYN
jgi:hypothetical protein